MQAFLIYPENQLYEQTASNWLLWTPGFVPELGSPQHGVQQLLGEHCTNTWCFIAVWTSTETHCEVSATEHNARKMLGVPSNTCLVPVQK